MMSEPDATTPERPTYSAVKVQPFNDDLWEIWGRVAPRGLWKLLGNAPGRSAAEAIAHGFRRAGGEGR